MESFAGLGRFGRSDNAAKPAVVSGASRLSAFRLSGASVLSGASGLSSASAAHCYMPSAPNPPLI